MNVKELISLRSKVKEFDDLVETLRKTGWTKPGDMRLRELADEIKVLQERNLGFINDKYKALGLKPLDLTEFVDTLQPTEPEPDFDCHICGKPGGH